ncbi:MAG TPA: DNA-directed RNA polymerase subunit beta', partial [Microbacteriaceae bacterium]|nr:DNA-directed RNA polymerase subunit beta' [Microbacteriaceae bacterium]
MLERTGFNELQIRLATAEDIRSWSYGEVKKPETINYRTLKPEKDGLFGEQIFGPSRDWECACGKYKRVRYKGIICERCGVEVTKSSVRRERMGHIELAAPVTHIWYFKGVPSRLGYLLDMAPKDLEKVIYFAAYMVIDVDEDGRHEDLPGLEKELQLELKSLEDERDLTISERMQQAENDLAALEAEGAKADQKRRANASAEKEIAQIRKQFDDEINLLRQVWDDFRSLKVGDLKPEDAQFGELMDRYGEYFEAYMGAEAIKRRLEAFDLATESEDLHLQIAEGKGQKKIRAIKRLKVVNSFLKTGASPSAMVLDVVPVIPPELRPMVQLDGGRFATSDLNDLYRRVINRNNRLRRLLDLGAPEIIVNNEKRMLQEAVDALFDNGRRGRPVTGTGNRALKSLSDMLKGKQGRFRQNLLGKRVDYSGRSVIVVGPQLELHQCGLPKQMALELFKPFAIKRLIDLGHAHNIKAAKRMVERSRPEVWDVLEEIIRERPVLLNRAPTLHRLGIQAFEPLLVEGKAIQLHPLVCAAFNADFDGDQMAVHLPLSVEAQAEARILMLASNNILKPSDGRPVTLPTQDMVIGLHHLTTEKLGAIGEGRAFSSVAEAILAMDQGSLDLGSRIRVRISDYVGSKGEVNEKPVLIETTLGRALFNEALPKDYPYFEGVADKTSLSSLVNDLAERYPKIDVAQTLDRIKDAGFYWATRSGVTVALSDIVAPENKAEIVASYEKLAAAVQKQFDKGLITDTERRSELIDIWTKATDEVAVAMQEALPADNSINRMVTSGARGNWLQIRNIAGMRGLVNNPKGEIIPRPILSSYREGLSVAEYFIATHGARKGLADTALRTADSGYLTRRLVDVSQDVIIREEDCGTSRGLDFVIANT